MNKQKKYAMTLIFDDLGKDMYDDEKMIVFVV